MFTWKSTFSNTCSRDISAIELARIRFIVRSLLIFFISETYIYERTGDLIADNWNFCGEVKLENQSTLARLKMLTAEADTGGTSKLLRIEERNNFCTGHPMIWFRLLYHYQYKLEFSVTRRCYDAPQFRNVSPYTRVILPFHWKK